MSGISSQQYWHGVISTLEVNLLLSKSVCAECDEAALSALMGFFSGCLFAHFGNRQHSCDGNSRGPLASLWISLPYGSIEMCYQVHV